MDFLGQCAGIAAGLCQPRQQGIGGSALQREGGAVAAQAQAGAGAKALGDRSLQCAQGGVGVDARGVLQLLGLGAQGLQADWASGRLQLGGQVQLDALALSSRLSTLKPMGSYRLVLQGASVPTLTLQTLEGALQLSGSGQWVGQRLRFSGEARAAPEREAALSNLLNIIGRRSGARSLITLG